MPPFLPVAAHVSPLAGACSELAAAMEALNLQQARGRLLHLFPLLAPSPGSEGCLTLQIRTRALSVHSKLDEFQRRLTSAPPGSLRWRVWHRASRTASDALPSQV